MKLKKGDQVKIIKGKDRGKTGKVLRVLALNSKIVVEGLNISKKHMRPKKSGEKGQRVEIPVPLSSANVMLVCPSCGKISRIGYKMEKNNKIRICKKCQGQI